MERGDELRIRWAQQMCCGIALLNRRRNEDALTCIQANVELSRSKLREFPAFTAISQILLGTLLINRGEYEAAQLPFKEARTVVDSMLEEDRELLYAAVQVGIGSFALTLAKYSEAEEFFKRALDSLFVDPLRYAQQMGGIYLAMGELHFVQKQWDLALPYYERVLLIDTGHSRYGNLNLALAQGKIGLIYYLREQYSEAGEALRSALEHFDLAHWKSSPLKAACANALGIIYLREGELQAATNYIQWALELIESWYSRQSDVYIDSMNYVGASFLRLGKAGQARGYFERVVTQLDPSISPAASIATLAYLSDIARKSGSEKLAEEYFAKFNTILEHYYKLRYSTPTEEGMQSILQGDQEAINEFQDELGAVQQRYGDAIPPQMQLYLEQRTSDYGVCVIVGFVYELIERICTQVKSRCLALAPRTNLIPVEALYLDAPESSLDLDEISIDDEYAAVLGCVLALGEAHRPLEASQVLKEIVESMAKIVGDHNLSLKPHLRRLAKFYEQIGDSDSSKRVEQRINGLKVR